MSTQSRAQAAPRSYLVDPWIVAETSFDPSLAPRGESVFALANGHLGLRGGFEEGAGNHADGTFLAGFFEEDPIIYGEVGHGYAKNRQVMMNVAGGTGIRLFVGDEPFDMRRGEVLAYRRSLDLREGVLSRVVRWRSPRGAVVELSTRRLVALGRAAVAAIDYFAKRVAGEGDLRVESSLDGAARNQAGGSDPRIGVSLREGGLDVVRTEGEGLRGALLQRTRRSRLSVACAMDHALAPGCEEASATSRVEAKPDRVTVHLRAGRSLRFTKHLAYVTSRDHPAERLVERAGELLDVGQFAFDDLVAEQRAHLATFWRDCDVEIHGDEAMQQGIRFALFHLLQAASPDPRTSVGAKGLTGEGYDGHYFWDTEIYVDPVFTYTQPARAEVLLRYRLGTLDRSRERAAELSQRGALVAWRTIDGRECSAYYPASTAQYHINADVAYALRRHVVATGDRSLLRDAAPLILETARLWADLGHFGEDGAFRIDEVTGPDEYSALVNNNLYTNLMAQEHLRWAVQVVDELRDEAPEAWERLARSIELTTGEVDCWRRAAAAMLLPYDRARGIHAQDEGFLSRKVWDFTDPVKHRPPLLLHHHPLVLYRHQVLKQPDVVLAQVLLGHRFTLADKRRNFAYYDPITTGDSSLSACAQSIAAAELGELELAQAYLARTARMDLEDVLQKSAAGLHAAALGGTWLAIVQGFAGMRDAGGELSFAPRLPAHWSQLRFRLQFRGRRLEVTVTQTSASYRLVEGEPLVLRHRGRPLEARTGAPTTVSLAPALRCVIFDLDGVLTRTSDLHYQAWARLAHELGLPFDRRLNERLKGVSRRESLSIILSHAGVTRDEREQERLAERKNGYYRELLKQLGPDGLAPGARALLGELRAEGIRTAIASVSHNVWEIVERLGIRDAVDLIVDPAEVVKGKPDPEIFLRAAEALGIDPEDCAGVEDAQAGIDAIRAARMLAIGVGTDLHDADWLVPEVGVLSCQAIRERFETEGEIRMVG